MAIPAGGFLISSVKSDCFDRCLRGNVILIRDVWLCICVGILHRKNELVMQGPIKEKTNTGVRACACACGGWGVRV